MENKDNRYEDTFDRFLNKEYIDEVVSEFLPLLIMFRNFDKPYGTWEKSELTDFCNYPFIGQYFDFNFPFMKTPIYDKVSEEEPIQELSEYELSIINGIGSKIKEIDVYLGHKNEYFEGLNNKELTFVITNISALLELLTFITEKLFKNKEKYPSIIKKETQKEDINLLKDALLRLDLQYNICNEKYDLILNLFKICTKEKLIRTRQVFSKRLSNIKKEKSVENTTLLAWLGIKQQTLSDYFHANTLPDTAKLIILSQQLNISLDYLLGIANSPFQSHTSYDAFSSLGFTPQSFSSIIGLKNNNIWQFAHLINALNYLLEEDNLATLSSLAQFLNHHNADSYYTVGTAEIDRLETIISTQVENGDSLENIRQNIQHFKSNLSRYDIKSEDATKLLDIQDKLRTLKQKLFDSGYNPDESIMNHISQLWLENTETEEESEIEDLEEEPSFIEAELIEDDQSSEPAF